MAKHSTSARKAGTYVRRATGQKAVKVAAPRSASKAQAKPRVSVDYAALVRRVEDRGQPVRVPGRRVAVVPLATLERLRELERAAREAEDRADAEAFLRHEREPGDWKPWSELRPNAVA